MNWRQERIAGIRARVASAWADGLTAREVKAMLAEIERLAADTCACGACSECAAAMAERVGAA